MLLNWNRVSTLPSLVFTYERVRCMLPTGVAASILAVVVPRQGGQRNECHWLKLAVGQVAQLVEHRTENAGVGGSNPPLAISERDITSDLCPDPRRSIRSC